MWIWDQGILWEVSPQFHRFSNVKGAGYPRFRQCPLCITFQSSAEDDSPAISERKRFDSETSGPNQLGQKLWLWAVQSRGSWTSSLSFKITTMTVNSPSSIPGVPVQQNRAWRCYQQLLEAWLSMAEAKNIHPKEHILEQLVINNSLLPIGPETRVEENGLRKETGSCHT